MSWATQIAKQTLGLGFYATVSGLPHILATFDLPSSWGTGGVLVYGGETYTWHNVLLLDDQLDAIDVSLQPWIGIGDAGALDLRLYRTDAIRALFEVDVADTAVLKADLSVSATTATADTTAAIATSGDLFIGLETVTYTGTTSTTVTGLTRGAYGSTPQEHAADLDQAAEVGYGGAYCGNTPLRWQGRTVRLYACPGHWSGGVFTPASDTVTGAGPITAEGGLLFAGTLTSTEEDLAANTLTLACSDLTKLLDREVGGRVARATAGPEAGLIHIAPDNWRISFAVEYRPTSVLTPVYAHRERLQRDVSGTPTDVAEGLYEPWEVASFIAYTMEQVSGLSGWSGVLITTEEATWQLNIVRDPGGAGVWLHILVDAPDLLWQELGYTESVVSEDPTLVSGTAYLWTMPQAQEKRPSFRLPAGDPGDRVLPYQLLGSLNFQRPADHGWTYGDGSAVSSYALLGEEIVGFTSTSTLGDYSTIIITERGALGTRVLDHYVEEGDDALELVQVIGAEAISWPRFALYLLSSGYGAAAFGGWRGCAGAIPADVVDTSSFTALATDGTDRRRTFAVVEPTPLRDILGPMAVLDQAWIGVRDGLLHVEALAIPLEHETQDPAVTLSDDNVITSAGLTVDRREDALINDITGENWGYDPGAGEGSTLTLRDGTSAGTWGKGSLSIDLRMLGGSLEEQRARFLSAAAYLISRYGMPYRVVSLSVSRAEVAWQLQVGETVAIDLPALSSSVLGAVVIGRSPIYRAQGESVSRGSLTLAIWRVGGWRVGAYSPCLWSTAQTYSAPTTTLKVDVNRYTESPDDDVNWFSVGDVVRCYELGDESTATTNTITAISSGTVLVSGTTPSAPVVIVEAVTWGTVADTQQHYVFTSGGDRILGTSDGAYFYG